MKLSVAVLLLAFLTVTLARSHKSFKLFRREFGGGDEKEIKKIEKEIDQEIELGEVLAKDIAKEEHQEKDGDISICALELLEDIGHAFEGAFAEGDLGDKKGGDDDGKDGGDYEYDEKMSILGKLFRHKRRAQSIFGEFGPTYGPTGSGTGGPSYRPTGYGTGGPSYRPTGYGTGGPSYRPTGYGTGGPSYRPTSYGTGRPSYGPSGPWYPSFGPTGGQRKCNGALEKFFKCMKKVEGKGPKGKGGNKGGASGDGSGEK